eukprot:scaffold663445_cov75-Prasinocladus_malaysianus.AAC.1
MRYSQSRHPVVDPSTGRYLYFRRGYCDRNVVPYMPDLLLLWGAHCNVQLVTNAAFSRYLLKYALKAEEVGTPNLSTQEAISALHLNNVSKEQ